MGATQSQIDSVTYAESANLQSELPMIKDEEAEAEETTTERSVATLSKSSGMDDMRMEPVKPYKVPARYTLKYADGKAFKEHVVNLQPWSATSSSSTTRNVKSLEKPLPKSKNGEKTPLNVA